MKIQLSESGMLRLAVVSPELKVADVGFNAGKIILALERAYFEGCSIAIFPELALTGYTCGDLFFQKALLDSVKKYLQEIADYTKDKAITLVVGAPIECSGRLFNTAVFISGGKILGIVPKTYICNSSEYYEKRWFCSAWDLADTSILLNNAEIPIGADLLFQSEDFQELTIGIEICEDLWAVSPPSLSAAIAGANVLLNLSASNEYLGKSKYRKQLVESQSARCIAAYCYSSAGAGESSTDLAFSGHSIIAENGVILAETERFKFDSQLAVCDIDIEKLNNDRMKNSSFGFAEQTGIYRIISFELNEAPVKSLLRNIPKTPFVPQDDSARSEVCREIFAIQTIALAKRLKHTNLNNVVIGISGGLDSTLALLVCVKTFDMLQLDRKGIIAITMPGFGTTKRTKSNAVKLSEALGVTIKIIPISKSVILHFKDISHEPSEKSIVYENAQARKRTHILMDIANQVGGIVVGTGDMSELALGWCTYSGDQMSMYGVNSSIPKTLIRYIIEWVSECEFKGLTSKILKDISVTPISPELLPPDEKGNIIQETEKSIGPYILHDFFLYYFLRCGYPPAKILLFAEQAFSGEFTREEISDWLKVFIQRFFSQQFKRSCMPDGVKVGTVALSPRGDWRMPSDAVPEEWLRNLSNKE